jgi:L-threonylcarbamoyladenylate synthase
VVDALPTLDTLVTGGRSTVGIRVPNHDVTLSILAALDDLVAAPSANRFGRVSPTAASHVQDEFGPELVVVDGGQSNVGVESTIVDLSNAQPRLLRQGAIDVVQLQEVLGTTVETPDASAIVNTVSGTMLAHYAPRAKVVIVEASQSPDLRLTTHERYWDPDYLGTTSAQRARNLYRELRGLDDDNVTCAWVVLPPETDALDRAVRDRLSRAAATE